MEEEEDDDDEDDNEREIHADETHPPDRMPAVLPDLVYTSLLLPQLRKCSYVKGSPGSRNTNNGASRSGVKG